MSANNAKIVICLMSPFYVSPQREENQNSQLLPMTEKMEIYTNEIFDQSSWGRKGFYFLSVCRNK